MSDFINTVDVLGDEAVTNSIIDRTIKEYSDNYVSWIGSHVFRGCTSLTSVSFPAVTSIGTGAFNNCRSLTSVSFPVATYLGDYAFYSCRSLTSVSFPVATYLGDYAFYGCTSLTSVNFPVATSIGTSAFYGCTSLTSVSFPAVARIGTSAFYGCTSLATLYLSGSSVCTLTAANAFTNTLLHNGFGSIFVPASLVSSYKTATNWTLYSNQIFATP